MYDASATVDRIASGYRHTVGGVSCVRTRWQYFSAVNDVIVAIFIVWRQIENPTSSVNAYLLEEQSCQFNPDPIWNDGTLIGCFVEVGAPQQEEQKQQDKQQR